MSIGARLKEWRLIKGLTQRGASSIFGVSYGVYQKYEYDSSVPGGDAITAFIHEGFNANWLLTGEGEMLLADQKASTQPVPSPDALNALDIERLRLAIETVEEVLLESNRKMTPAKKAEAIALAYDIFEEEEADEALAHTKKILAKLVKSLA